MSKSYRPSYSRPRPLRPDLAASKTACRQRVEVDVEEDAQDSAFLAQGATSEDQLDPEYGLEGTGAQNARKWAF